MPSPRLASPPLGLVGGTPGSEESEAGEKKRLRRLLFQVEKEASDQLLPYMDSIPKRRQVTHESLCFEYTSNTTINYYHIWTVFLK